MVTIATEKSEVTKARSSARNAITTKTSCAAAAGCASCIHGRMPRCAPIIGNDACASAMTSARTSA